MRPRQQRANRDDGAGARKPEHQRDQRPFAETGQHQAAVDEGPQRQSRERKGRPRSRAIGQGENIIGEQIARIEIDRARTELIDHGPAGRDMRRFEQCQDAPDQQRRQAARRLGDHEKHRQQIDEPQRAERLDEGFQIHEADMAPIRFGGKRWRLEAELDRHPQHVEVSEMDDLAVQINAPVAGDHNRQEQARDQEEIRHPERLCEGDQNMHEAGLAGGQFDAQHRMHHDDHDDADAFGIVHPIDASRRGRRQTLGDGGCAFSCHRCPFSARRRRIIGLLGFILLYSYK